MFRHTKAAVAALALALAAAPALAQEGTLDKMLAPKDLIRRYTGGDNLAEGTMLFGGTFSAIGGIRSAPRFDFELVDDVIGRKISHGYDILSLPIAG